MAKSKKINFPVDYFPIIFFLMISLLYPTSLSSGRLDKDTEIKQIQNNIKYLKELQERFSNIVKDPKKYIYIFDVYDISSRKVDVSKKSRADFEEKHGTFPKTYRSYINEAQFLQVTTLQYLYRITIKDESFSSKELAEWIKAAKTSSDIFKQHLIKQLGKIATNRAEQEQKLKNLQNNIVVPPAPRKTFFRKIDLDALVPSLFPERIRQTWYTESPSLPASPEGIMLTGTWDSGGEVNIIIAMEAYGLPSEASDIFSQRVISLKQSFNQSNQSRIERNGPRGEIKEDANLFFRTWLPHQGSDWIGEHKWIRRYTNIIITISASYLNPVNESQLVKIMQEMEQNACKLADFANQRILLDQ